MKKFLAIFYGAASDAEKKEVTPEESQKFMEGWMKWAQDHATALVDSGTPLSSVKKVSGSGSEGIRNDMTAYTIVQAESLEEAAKIFESHPHITFFPGNRIEVVECAEVPQA